RRRHTRFSRDWSSDVCSSDLTFYNEERYLNTSRQMLKNVLSEIEHYPPGCSNWLDLMMNFTHPFYEVVITGKDALSKKKQLNTRSEERRVGKERRTRQ